VLFCKPIPLLLVLQQLYNNDTYEIIVKTISTNQPWLLYAMVSYNHENVPVLYSIFNAGFAIPTHDTEIPVSMFPPGKRTIQDVVLIKVNVWKLGSTPCIDVPAINTAFKNLLNQASLPGWNEFNNAIGNSK